MALIRCEGVSLAYGARQILHDISLSVEPGDRLAILGGNGSGKSSLLQLMAGWGAGRHATGSVTWRDRPWVQVPVVERARAVQLAGQIPAQNLSGRAFTVEEELAFGPENLGLPRAEIRARVDRALTLGRIERLAARNPFTLSGGEQQRLVIAAALTLDPQALLLDEPLSNLDPESREAMIAVLEGLPPDLALVMAEIDPAAVAALTRRALFLDGGRVALTGPTPAVLRADAVVQTLGLPALTEAWLRQTGQGPEAAGFLPLTPADLEADRDAAARAFPHA